MTEPRATVVVPMYNAADHVHEQIEALAKQSVPADELEVVFVDNGSSDDTIALVNHAIAARPNMRLLRASATPTSFFARNAGAATSAAPFLLFCDADDVAAERWAEGMLGALERFDVVGGSLEFSLLNPGSPPVPSPSDIEVRHGFLPANPTSNLGIRRVVFEALGGFRDQYLSGEDFGLCWRAQLAGYSIGFAPGAIVHFRFRPSKTARFVRQFRFGHRHRAWSAAFVSAGAEDLRVPLVIRRIGGNGLAVVTGPQRRERASAVAWYLGVLYSYVRPPRARARRVG